MYVVMVFCPVVSDEQHQWASLGSGRMNPVEPKDIWRQPNGSVLKPARHPMSARDDLTNQPGHDLDLGIDDHSRRQQYGADLPPIASDDTHSRHARTVADELELRGKNEHRPRQGIAASA